MEQKQTFKLLLAALAIMLVLLPFMTTLNELMTRVAESSRLYMAIQNVVVPWEVKMIGVLLSPFRFDFVAHPSGMTVNGRYVGITWNCIGWQGSLLLGITFLAGFQGSYTRLSKLQAVLIGILGTFFG